MTRPTCQHDQHEQIWMQTFYASARSTFDPYVTIPTPHPTPHPTPTPTPTPTAPTRAMPS
ncbi:uncharacterized protein AC631_03797 [Debaryomyces fabryi]|uniref:Uncharacterized protein n=1 Tax=Debaryomyces fabryi TaxID=58627 RepID=A0A0V1PWA3_9ASCO|nr:uncharacterized protein AC631_03797 [Debaryomyces fabryi]KSA00470.1 hypothetical protein AC631_03797 [Debaryomyces fabryi]CUM46520.1 unnamed protein product [Debaryomyces fabryi]